MSQQGPILVVSTAGQPSFTGLSDDAGLFPVIETDWADAARAVAQVAPAAVVVAMSGSAMSGSAMSGSFRADLAALAAHIAAREPYVPLIVVEPAGPLAANTIPFVQ